MCFTPKGRCEMTDNEILKKIDILNAVNDINFQWQYRRAQKDHIDLFDKKIRKNERYFRLRMGGDYKNDLKLTHDSMTKMLLAVFAPLPSWEKDANKLIADRMDHARKIIDNLRT